MGAFLFPSLRVGRLLIRRVQNESFTYYSNYTEAQLLTPAGFLLESIGAPEFDEKFVYKKYANKSAFSFPLSLSSQRLTA